jgi:formate/nitrite transporter FocA (FNT family)
MSDTNDNLLNKLREKRPSDMQIHKWNTAVQFEVGKYNKKFHWSHLIQLATAAFCGLIVGALLFGNFTNDRSNKENTDFASENATVEVIYAKM